MTQAAGSGYEFTIEHGRRLLRFRMWGMWDEDLTEAFAAAFRSEQAKLGPGPFQIYVDLLEFPTQRPEISEMIKAPMKYAADRGLTRAGHAVGAAMTQFQIRRMGNESHDLEFGFFATEREALDWLDQFVAV